MNGVDSRIVERRRLLANGIFSRSAGEIDATLLDALAAEVPQREVFVVARDADVAGRLKKSPGLVKMFENSAATVFAVRQAHR